MGGAKRKFRSQRRKVRHGKRKKKEVDGDLELENVNETVNIVNSSVPVQFSSSSVADVAGPSTPSVSSSKLPIPSPSPTENIQGNRFIDMDILIPVIEMFPCPNCMEKGLKCSEQKRDGLACKFQIYCPVPGCKWEHIFLNTKKTKHLYQINRRAYYAMRRCGGGHRRLQKFCYLMNYPPPVSERNYRKITTVVNTAVKALASEIMLDAANDLRVDTATNEPIDVGVSFDGTWQWRGFTSMNGAVVAISIDTGRVLDVDVMSRFCQVCATDKDKTQVTTHNCLMNHDGSAPKMEQSGIIRMFERSVSKNNLYYAEYYGDGDTKSFSAVKNIYPEKTVLKKECLGHVQKRVGKRIRALKKIVPGLGKLGLSDATIDRLQNYYGIALRSNVSSVELMKK